jgi:hypothetical protein
VNAGVAHAKLLFIHHVNNPWFAVSVNFAAHFINRKGNIPPKF